MPSSAKTPPRGPGESRGGVARAVAVFVVGLALGFAGLYLVAGDEIFRVETYRVRDPSLLVAALCVLAFFAEWFVMDPARIWLLCRNQEIPLPFRTAVLVHLSSMFVASVTPGNVAVGPATALALRRLGVPFGKGFGVAIQVFIFDMIFFAWAVPLSLGYLVYTDTLRLPPGPEFAALAIAVLAIVGAVFLSRYPRPVVRLILVAAKLPLLGRFESRIRGMARDYYRSALAFKNMAVSTWLAINVVVGAGWFSGFVLFWLLLELYGVETGLLATLAILTSVTLVAHLFPTPGGSGFMEAALGLSIGAGGGAAAALLIWRLASYHAIFFLGPPAAWLLYLSKPVADDGGSGSA
jgi:glycosyltransferase 2 family protein